MKHVDVLIKSVLIAVSVLSRWLKRSWILIGDGGFACVRLAHACIKKRVTLVSRLRLDTALYEFAPIPAKGQLGRHREKGERVTSLAKLALDSTQPGVMFVLIGMAV
jgi:hypothetical protein